MVRGGLLVPSLTTSTGRAFSWSIFCRLCILHPKPPSQSHLLSSVLRHPIWPHGTISCPWSLHHLTHLRITTSHLIICLISSHRPVSESSHLIWPHGTTHPISESSHHPVSESPHLASRPSSLTSIKARQWWWWGWQLAQAEHVEVVACEVELAVPHTNGITPVLVVKSMHVRLCIGRPFVVVPVLLVHVGFLPSAQQCVGLGVHTEVEARVVQM